MAILNLTGAETGDLSEATNGVVIGTAAWDVSTAVVRSGTYAYRYTGNSGGANIAALNVRKYGATAKEENIGGGAYLTFWMYFVGFNGSVNIHLSAAVNGVSSCVQMQVDSLGQVNVIGNTNSGVIATLNSGQWYRFDLRGTNGGTGGLSIDGGAESTVTCNAQTPNYASFVASNSGVRYVDDIVLSDSPIAGGELHVTVAVPTGNSAANTAWTASTGNKWACIDEVPPSGTDYINSGTGAGQQNYSATHASAATLGITGGILAVKTVARMREASSTSTLGAVGIRSGTTNFAATEVDIGDTNPITMAAVYTNDPNTSAAWTASGFNAAEPLVRRSSSDTSDIRCEALYLMIVWWVPPIEVTPDPFQVEWTGFAPEVALLTEAVKDSELQWALGGAALANPEFQWTLGGRASREVTMLWQVAPSPLRIEYALTGRTGPVTYSFRFERRTRTNQFLQDVTPAVLGGTIEGNNNRAIFRTGTFTINPLARDADGNAITINPLADHLAVFMDLLVDGNYTLAIPMGLFALTVPRKTMTPGGETWEVEAHDNCIHLVESTTTETYTIDAGENYLTGTNAAADILTAQSIPFALPTTDKVLPAPQSWPPGTPWLVIVNWLLDRVNLYQLACDASGVARTRVRDEMSGRTPDVTYSGEDLLLIPIEEEAETTRLANQVIAVVDDPAQPPLSAVVTNNDPSNPISVAALGRVITRVIPVDGAPDAPTIEAIARNYLEREAGLYRRATLLTSIDPRREANEIYEVNADGVYVAERWWAQNWAFELTIGTQMVHTVGKVERITA